MNTCTTIQFNLIWRFNNLLNIIFSLTHSLTGGSECEEYGSGGSECEGYGSGGSECEECVGVVGVSVTSVLGWCEWVRSHSHHTFLLLHALMQSCYRLASHLEKWLNPLTEYIHLDTSCLLVSIRGSYNTKTIAVEARALGFVFLDLVKIVVQLK